MTNYEYDHIISNLSDIIYNLSNSDSIATRYYKKGLISAYIDVLKLVGDKNYIQSLKETIKNEYRL